MGDEGNADGKPYIARQIGKRVDPVQAADGPLQLDRIPGQVVMDDVGAMSMQIDICDRKQLSQPTLSGAPPGPLTNTRSSFLRS